MTHLEALVALNLIDGIGSVMLKRLLDYFGRPQDLFKASLDRLTLGAGISRNLAARIRAFKKEDLDKEFESTGKLGLKIMTLDDDEYPANLKNIPGAPVVLYVKGELKEEDKYSIAVVGSRMASFYGLTNAEKFAFDLSKEGFTVVSGMARGIDTYAHRGALKAAGRTIAVMGSGFNHIYPDENKEIAQDIARSGAVISEFPVNSLPLKQNFPRRNRIISGLSLGVLVAEASQNSGALITADFALEQGREVFAFPGKVDSLTSYGTNALIKQGAKLVTCIEDILEEFDLNAGQRRAHPSFACAKTVHDKCEEEVYGLLSDEPVLLDNILEKTDMDITRLSGILLKLQMKKLVIQLPGKQFARKMQ